MDSFRAEQKDFDEVGGEVLEPLREHRNASLSVTGITVAAGNPLMARVYAKDIELRQAGREEKRAIEHRIWSEHGWDGVAPVTRVEFQCRGEFLDEIRLRDPRALGDNVDAAFQHCVRWLRLIEPGSSSRRTRSRLDPRWVVVTSTEFAHEADPIMRDRKHRGGALPSHVAGAVQSALAANRRLDCAQLVTPDGEVFENESDFANALSPSDAEAWVRECCAEQFSRAADLCANDALTRHGPNGAVLALVSHARAVCARFSSVDMPKVNER